MNKKINNYLEFIQFKHTVFALPFALCSYILVSVKIGFQISDLVLILIALVSARIFGMSINRIFDVNIDKNSIFLAYSGFTVEVEIGGEADKRGMI